ncbi:MAG: hypothetical protein KBD63_02265 [Bacteriovoracaceae bacterium]|nr:hypothetical protein [Bacteriovoracaceae bacterium]
MFSFIDQFLDKITPQGNILSWILTALFLSILIYTLKIIRAEKKNEIKLQNFFTLHSLSFKTPTWWELKLPDSKHCKVFLKKEDATFLGYFFWSHENNSIDNILKNYLEKNNIIFDTHEFIMSTDTKKFSASFAPHLQQALRYEGMATLNAEERIYCDIFVFHLKNEQGYYFFENRSSVLHGMVEGPYFEAVLKSLELTSANRELTNTSH